MKDNLSAEDLRKVAAFHYKEAAKYFGTKFEHNYSYHQNRAVELTRMAEKKEKEENERTTSK